MPGGPYLVVGLARSGRAVARLLVERGERVIGCDSGRPDGAEGLRELGVEVHLDADGVDLLGSVATVVKSPGVPPGAAVVVAARRRRLDVIGELELAWRAISNAIVAVTGTNGKTTTSEMIGHIYRASGRPVEVAGNVGRPLSEIAGRVDPAATVVCEASSFQLEDAVEFAPECGVFLNLSPDHLDRHGTLSAYREAKLRIFAKQSSSDLAVLNGDDPAMPDAVRARTIKFCQAEQPASCEVTRVADAIYADRERLIGVDELNVLGEHNVTNAMAAAAAGLAMGVSAADVRSGLAGFKGVSHRLEPVRERGGVLFVNDSKATNVSAAATALGAFDRPVRVILGGSSKGEDFSSLAKSVVRRCRACYLIGQAAEEVEHGLAGVEQSGVELRRCSSLVEAVERAVAEAERGDVVLLSPGCASFDAFRDFAERGDTFRRLVEGLE